MKSQGEIEAAVCDGISRFQQEFIGRGPRDIHAHLIGTLLVVRLQGVLTPAERQLIAPRPGPADNGGPAAEAARRELQVVLDQLNPAGGIPDRGDPSGRHKGKLERERKARSGGAEVPAS